MPSPDKLFRLDPVETKITAPVSNFQVLAEAADRSVANRSLDRGLAAFSQTLGGLAQFKKQQQIRDDIKTAKDAAVRGEVMPNVLPVAEAAYRNVIDKNTASESLLAIDRWENGDEFNALIKSETPSDQKTSQIEASYDDFYARAVQSMQNPDLIQNLRLTVNALKEKSYQKVYQRERDLKTIEGIHGLKNTLGEAKRFAEATGIPLIDTLTPNWLQANAKDLGKSHPYLSLSERKLLAFQTLTTDQDVLADPQIIEEIMKSKYNKGFTFRNLYEGKGDDAEEFKKIYKAYTQNSKDYFKKLEDDAKDSNEKNIAQFKETIRQEYIGAGKTSAKGISKRALDSGLFDEAKANKLEKDTQKYMDTNIKFQEGSPEDIAMVDFILAQGVTLETQVDDLVLEGRLNPALATKYKSYLKEENKQKLAFIGKYKEQVKDIAKNVLSLSKLTLKNKLKDVFTFTGREPTMSELLMAMNGSGLPAEQVNLIIQQVQDLHNGLNAQAEKLGIQDSIADRADGAVPFEHLQKFQLIVESQVSKLAEAIKVGLKPRERTSEVNLPSLEFPVIPTSDEFPLVVNQTKDIFSKSGFALKTGPDVSPIAGSGIATFDIETSFTQNQNMTLRSYLLDATTKNWPKPLSDVVIAMIVQERKDKEAEPDTPLKQAIRRKQETLDNIDTWFSDLGEDLGMIPGFLKEVLTPGLDMKTGKMREPYADLSPEKQKELIQRKRDNLDNIDKSIVDSGKNLLNLITTLTQTNNETPNETTKKSNIPTVGTPAGKAVEPAAIPTTVDTLPSAAPGLKASIEKVDKLKDETNLKELEEMTGITEKSTIRTLGEKVLRGANSILEAITGDVEGAEVPNMPLVKGPLSKAALFGANHYNASPGVEERTTWATNADKGIKKYRKGTLTKKEQFNITQLLTTLSKAKSSFIGDLKVVGLTFDQFKELMIGVYSAETAFGLSKNKISKTNVVGELQVTRGTFRDVSKPKGNFGPLMAKAVGFKSIQEIRNLSDKQLKDKLLNDNKFNYIAGAAVMLNKLQTANKKFK